MAVAEVQGVEQALRDLVDEQMKRWNAPGVELSILDRGEIASAGFGVTSIETQQPVTPSTVFQIGSITKVYTATLIMQLVDEGLVELDSPVTRYLPDLKLADEAALQTITLRHLLTHSSGIDGDFFEDFGFGDDALGRCIAKFDTLRQVYSPGELWSYCNSGFYLAGHIIATLREKPFEQCMREHLFEPLGMERSVMSAHEAIHFPVAIGHRSTADSVEIARPWMLPRSVAAAGLVISTTEDMLKFAALHMGNGTVGDKQVLSQGSIRAMQEPQVEGGMLSDRWGLAWMIRTIDGVTIIEHGGTTNGQNAWLMVLPGEGLAVAVLTNSSQGSAIYKRIVDWVLENRRGLRRPQLTRVTLESRELAGYAGHYGTTNALATLVVEGENLVANVQGRGPAAAEAPVIPPVTMAPIGNDLFVATDGVAEGLRTHFVRRADGSIRFFQFGGRFVDPLSEEEFAAAEAESHPAESSS